MSRQPRIDIGNTVYHIINRANAGSEIFTNEKEYQLFEKILEDTKEITDMRILSYCIMPNHWHFVLYPESDGDLSLFMKYLTNTHTRQWHAKHKTIGGGHLYQGRYKSFLVQTDQYLTQVCRYVERNSLQANLVQRAQDWKWSSLWRREFGTVAQKKLLSEWPIDVPHQYLNWVNEYENKEDLENIRCSIKKSKPFGSEDWVEDTILKHGLEYTAREPGRPRL